MLSTHTTKKKQPTPLTPKKKKKKNTLISFLGARREKAAPAIRGQGMEKGQHEGPWGLVVGVGSAINNVWPIRGSENQIYNKAKDELIASPRGTETQRPLVGRFRHKEKGRTSLRSSIAGRNHERQTSTVKKNQ